MYTRGDIISCGNGIFERMITIIGDLLCPAYDIPRQTTPVTRDDIMLQKLARQEKILQTLLQRYIEMRGEPPNKETFREMIRVRIQQDSDDRLESDWTESIRRFFVSDIWTSFLGKKHRHSRHSRHSRRYKKVTRRRHSKKRIL